MIFKLGKFSMGYDAGETSRIRKDLGYARATPRDEDSLTSDGSLELMRQKAMNLRRNNPVVNGVCDRLASWTVGNTGIVPQCKTSDREWNRKAEAWWADYSQRCDYRKRASLWRMQWQAVSLRPTHGGFFLERLSNGQIRPIECERIRDPKDREAAKLCKQGVKIDQSTGEALGYWVHNRAADGSFSGDHAERFVKAENMIPVTRPAWRPDQVREVPDLASVTPAMQDVHEMNTYTLNTAKVQSMIIGVMKRLGGVGANSGMRGSTTPTAGQRQTFATDWGQIMEGFPGEDLDLKSSPTPSGNHIPYMKLQLMLAANALDVPYEWFTLDFSTADFSRQKAILTLVNKSMRNWRAWIIESMMAPLWQWRVAMAIRDGELDPAPTADVRGNEVSEWAKVEWQSPEDPWTDRQEANQADTIEFQLGLGPLSNAAKRRGGDLEGMLRQKAEDLRLAGEIEAEFGLSAGTLIHAEIPGQTEGRQKKKDPKPADDEPDEEDDAIVPAE